MGLSFTPYMNGLWKPLHWPWSLQADTRPPLPSQDIVVILFQNLVIIASALQKVHRLFHTVLCIFIGLVCKNFIKNTANLNMCLCEEHNEYSYM